MFLVCGDSMEDIYIKGETSRISPEAPVPIVKVIDSVKKPGGAANVFLNVQALAMPVRGLYSPSSPKDPVQKLRILSRGQQVVRIDYDRPQDPIKPSSFKPEGWIIFSDYGKGALKRVAELISRAPKSTIFVDPKSADYECYRGASYIKPNKDEMRDLVGGWISEAQLDTKAWAVVTKFRLKGLLLTRGEEGMALYTPTTKHSVSASKREIFDVCGAGDTAIATFAVAIARGLTPKKALFYANKAAGITCQHLGSYSPSSPEVFDGCD